MSATTSLVAPSSSLQVDPEEVRRQLGDAADLAQPPLFPVATADARSCTYGAPNLVDANVATAWCEGASGPGEGEMAIVPLPGTGALQIRAGYGKSPTRYTDNARPKEVRVRLVGQGVPMPVQGELNRLMRVLGEHVVTLADEDGWQALPLPTWSIPRFEQKPDDHWRPPKDEAPHYIAVEIMSAYPGSRWQDTCISEIAAAPAAPDPG